MLLMKEAGGHLSPDEKGRTFATQSELMKDMRDNPKDYEGDRWTLHEPRPIFEVKAAQLYTVLKEDIDVDSAR
jgi:hypothetical protein